MKALKKYRWPLTGALLGVLVFLAVYGVRVLDPTSVDWILNSLSPDPIQHYLGWELFRRSPVHLPYIGANYNAVYPFRTSVLFTDSLPLAALFFKLLGGILPTRFQYFGWWGLLCYALQGGLAQAVIARIAGVQPTFGRDDKSKAAVAIIMSPGQTAKLWGSVLGAGVLVLFPALTMRTFAHEALAGTWLVLLALYLWLRSDELMSATRRACLLWGLMGLLCAGIHLYYLPMVGLVLVGYAVRRALQKRGPAAVLLPIAAFCAAALAELFLLGAFAVNFAGYSNGYLSGADYLGLFVPWLAPSWEQNVYMGLGAVLAVVLAIFSVVCNARKAERFFTAHHDWVVAGVVVLVLDLLAAGGNAITVGGKTLFTVPIPQFLMDFWAMFSSCARLAWVAGLLLAVAACGLVLRFWQKGVVPALMLAVCAVAQGCGQRIRRTAVVIRLAGEGRLQIADCNIGRADNGSRAAQDVRKIIAAALPGCLQQFVGDADVADGAERRHCRVAARRFGLCGRVAAAAAEQRERKAERQKRRSASAKKTGQDEILQSK